MLKKYVKKYQNSENWRYVEGGENARVDAFVFIAYSVLNVVTKLSFHGAPSRALICFPKTEGQKNACSSIEISFRILDEYFAMLHK